MKQRDLLERVKGIFESQGFDVEVDGNTVLATSEEDRIEAGVYSSEKYTEEDVESSGEEVAFVDEHLASAERENLSVIREKQEEPPEMPSFEMVGEVAVINSLDRMEEQEAVERIRSQHPGAKTVLLKEDPVSGEFRVADYRKLWGDGAKTVHTEFGVEMEVDVTEVYFSERFASERERVCRQVEEGEDVLVLFAGVGPFALLCCELSDPRSVTAVEKNPAAAEYLRRNIHRNGFSDIVTPVEMDATEFLEQTDEEFDRVVMPLPEKASQYLEPAVESTRQNGTVHFYTFSEDEQSARKEAETLMEEHRIRVLSVVQCGSRGPSSNRWCVDFKPEGT